MAGINLVIDLDDNGTPKIRKIAGSLGDLDRSASRSGKKWQDQWKKMGRSVDDVYSKMSRIAALPARIAGIGAGAGMSLMVKQGLSINATLERINTQYRVMTGSLEKANRLMAETVKFSAATPFMLDEVAEARKILLAFGMESLEWLRDTGDAAAFAQRPITELALTLGRIKSGATGEGFMRLAEMGVATRQMLEGEGLQFDRGGSYVGSTDAAMIAVQRIIRRRFGGMMDEMSRTWDGAWSTMKDNWNLLTGALTKPLFEKLKPRITELTDALIKFADSETVKVWAEKAAEDIDTVVEKAKGAAAWFRENDDIVSWGTKSAASMAGLMIAWRAIGALFAGGAIPAVIITALSAIAGWLWKVTAQTGGWAAEWIRIKQVVEDVTFGIRQKMEFIFTQAKSYGSIFAKFFGEVSGGAADWVSSKLSGNTDKAAEAGARVGGAFAWAFRTPWKSVVAQADAETKVAMADAWSRHKEFQARLDAELAVKTGAVVKTRPSGGGSVAAVPTPRDPRGAGASLVGMGVAGAVQAQAAAAGMAYSESIRQQEAFIAFSENLWSGYVGDTTMIVQRGFSDLLSESILADAENLKERLDLVWEGVRDSFVRMSMDMVAEWVFGQVKMRVAGALFQKKATQDAIAGGLKRIAVSEGETAAATTESYAKVAAAAADTHKAHAGIPFVGAIIAAGLVGLMLATMSKARARRAGGYVPGGGSGVEDDQVYRLSGGEYIQPRSAVERYGKDFMEAVRTGTYTQPQGGEIHLHFGESGNSEFERDVETQLVPVVEKLYRQGRLRFATGRP